MSSKRSSLRRSKPLVNVVPYEESTVKRLKPIIASDNAEPRELLERKPSKSSRRRRRNSKRKESSSSVDQETDDVALRPKPPGSLELRQQSVDSRTSGESTGTPTTVRAMAQLWKQRASGLGSPNFEGGEFPIYYGDGQVEPHNRLSLESEFGTPKPAKNRASLNESIKTPIQQRNSFSPFSKSSIDQLRQKEKELKSITKPTMKFDSHRNYVPPKPYERKDEVGQMVKTINVEVPQRKQSFRHPGQYDRGRRPSQAGPVITQREDVIKFEQGRIKALQEERLHIQKKTFTKWMNSFLQKARMEVEDLFTDLADGKKLLKLLEIISGEKLGKPNNGKMRVHKVENVNKSLAFLHTKVRLESIGAEDIVDGNPRLILGLIWTIILRFQIQEIEIDVDEDNESSEKKSAKDALLLWCQRKTNGYPGVAIHDFTGSWRSGLGFNALIHSHRPELIDYNALQPSKHIDNLNNAFDVAQNDLGIPRLLDAEDVDTTRPDEKSILTYVASYYHTFAKLKNEMKSGRRIANIVGQMVDTDRKKLHYERLTTDLMDWIKLKITELEDRNFPNSLEEIQKELLKFKQYRTIEKPPKYKELSEIEALYFHINTLLKSLNQPVFQPSEGRLIQELQKCWEGLESAEHRREVALRQELLRQERMEQLFYKFSKKSQLRESYAKEMIQVLTDPRYGNNMTQVDASLKKHEAISADIFAREERFNDLTAMCKDLLNGNYHGAEKVQKREQEISQKWQELLAILEKWKLSLNTQSSLMTTLREIDALMATIKELETHFKSEEVGPHLLAVEDLLQKHSLQELQVNAVGDTLRKLKRHGQQFIAANHADAPLLEERLALLDKAYGNLQKSSEKRRNLLEDARNLFQFVQDHEEEESWLIERQRICTAAIAAKDLRAVLSLQQKHKALQDEMKTRRVKSEQLCEAGRRLVVDKHPKSKEITARIESLQKQWAQLNELADLRKKQLENAAEAFQFHTDANEAESWLKEKKALVTSKDYGEDEPSAQALLARHKVLREEIHAYQGDITSLNTHAQKLIKSGIASLELFAEPEAPQEVEDEYVMETKVVPQEVWEDEPYDRVENKTVIEERAIPQVRALYSFDGQGMLMSKGEVMILLNKTNHDWWNVRKDNLEDGFVPANYVKEIQSKLVQVQVQKPEIIKDIKRVKKTKMVRQTIKVKKPKTPKVSPRKKQPGNETENVEKRQKNINEAYDELKELTNKRHLFLEDAIRLYGFYRECDDFEKWIKDKEKMLKTDDKVDNVESAKRKYEKFLTDLSASSKRIEALDNAVDAFVSQGHSQLDKVKSRQKHIHQLWDHLNWLKSQKEKSLEGASSVELFHRTCDEARDWMHEKMSQLDGADHGPDLKTVQALQRRHEHLERELAPVQEKINRVNLLANSVKSAYPHEKGNVNARQKEIQELWEKVKQMALERRARLQDAVGLQIFVNSSKNLLNWAANVKDSLNADETARDVTTAENLLKEHSELNDDIKAHEDEWCEVVDLGQLLLKRNPSLEDVSERLVKLETEHEAVQRGWLEKDNFLTQCLDLQLFNKEADSIDGLTSDLAAVLELTDLGDSWDQVKALEKRHEDLEKTLAAQDERINVFVDLASKLIDQNHYDSKYIEKRRAQVLNKRQAVKDLAMKRREHLQASSDFHEFSSKVHDLVSWISDKIKVASDESYRDLNNLERKVKKHETFESELRANEGQVRTVNKTGQVLIAEKNYRSDDISKMVKDLNSKWETLLKLSGDKGKRLRQALAQHTYNRDFEDIRLKIDQTGQKLKSKQVGTDLRNCKDLLKKHQNLENEMSQLKGKIDDLAAIGEEMVAEGHFDAGNIVKASKECLQKYEELKLPAKLRREMLEESLRFHKFGFELDAELQWVREHKPLATSETLGQNLHQAQSLHKKHKKLEAEIEGHQPMIDKTLASGQVLLEQKHPQTQQIKTLCKSLETEWSDLQSHAGDRAKKLELSLKAQQYFFDAGEVESWLSEKNDVLSSTDYGRDRDAATKLLTKHKALELELDSYSGIITEMGHVADKMVNNGHPDSKEIAARQQILSQQMKKLQKLASTRQQRLMESMYRHEYFLESAELEQWIKEQMQTATSEEFGQDYEHLLLLKNKFDDWKHRMESGSERFNQCEELARKLISNESPYLDEIEKKQDQLGESWEKLTAQTANREQRLIAAGEIHRFHRDVAEALSRIQEKDAALQDDLGRDLNSVLALIRKHEGFENDLLALEAQLQVLVEDAVRLQAQYPGQNAKQIAEQQQVVVDQWSELQRKANERRVILNASCDLQRFLSQIRDLMNWSSGLRASMMAEDKVSDLNTAQDLKAMHEAVKAEIEARETSFRSVVDLGESMIHTKHYAAQEISEKQAALLEERQKLHNDWHHKKIHLDQLIDLHFFLRDAKQIHTISSSQEAALSNNDFAASVDEVAAQVKKHDAFEKLVATQEERVAALQEHVAKLVQQNHFETPTIKQNLADVVVRRQKVGQLCKARRKRLEDCLFHAQFVRDVTEAQSWIDEKQKRLEAETNQGDDTTSLEEKIKKLQKHQAFQAELTANQPRISSIKKQGEQMIAKKHPSSPEVKQQVESLMKSWNRLMEDADNHGRGLEEAQDILEFNNQVEKIEAWIRDKEMMVQAGDVGRDYEHCLALQRKLDDVDSDMRVDDARIRAINALADKLIHQGRSDTNFVKIKRENLSSKWRELQGALTSYRDKLDRAREVHTFMRDLDDTSSRVAEKALAMSSTDTGRDLAAVEQLQRKQDAVEREMTAIEDKIKEHDGASRVLTKRFSDMAPSINEKLAALQEDWRRLQELKTKRRNALSVAYTKHKFYADLKELETWVNESIVRMKGKELPSSIAETEAAIQLHEERKAEIDGRQKTFKELKDFGLRLSEGDVNDDMKQSLEHLEDIRKHLKEAWEERKDLLIQALQLAQFREKADQAERWLSNKEAFLNNDDLGDSLAGVETLIQKHEAFDKTLTAQLVKLDELEKLAKQVSSNHYDEAGIAARLNLVLTRREKLKESSALRMKKLQDTKLLLKFLCNVYEVEAWLHGKLQIANDESYRDPSNLQAKIQKHAAFQAELQANKGRLASVSKEGNSLIDAEHFQSDDIEQQLQTLDNKWDELWSATKLKKQRLDEAYEALLFHRNVEELEDWMNDVEQALNSDDHGKDLAAVNHLLKKQGVLENDIVAHAEAVETVKETANNFVKNNHFMKEDLQETAMDVVRRYNSLQEPMQIRRDNLEDAVLLHQFIRDADEELQWLEEKEPIAKSEDLGKNLTEVQSLQKKHQALEGELISREPVISGLLNRAQQMARNNHFAMQTVEQKMSELQTNFIRIKDISSVRRLRLLDAVESQVFYAEASEASTLLKEKRPILTASYYGKDEDSVSGLMKKLEGVERDLVAFETTIKKLDKLSTGLVDRGHFDSENIQLKQDELENSYKELQELAKVRQVRLYESRKFYKFVREADEVSEWISDQTALAASEDYGTDVEHVELLIKKFDSFLAALHAAESRITSCIASGKTLLNENNPESERINLKIKETHQAWDDINELAHARQEALAGAKQVHFFDRTADETIAWIQEKDAVLSSEGLGQDLESIQALVRKHLGFETDLAAVKKQVESVRTEAEKLASVFPDTREHIESKTEDVIEAWTCLLENAADRREQLSKHEQLQTYFDQYRDLMAWVNEMIAKVTAPDLAQDVAGAEALITRHAEHYSEIDARTDIFKKFYADGENLIKQKHLLSDEVEDKILILKQRHKLLLDTMVKRKDIYEQNLDTQLFKRDAEMLENWLAAREPVLRDGQFGDSIVQVEDLIRKHEDFDKTILAQEDKFNALQRITLLEKCFLKQREEEAAARQAEKERVEKEKIEARKRKEVQRINDERRREDGHMRNQDGRAPEVNGTDKKSGSRLEVPGSPNLNKSGSLSQLFGDRIRSQMKRAESMKVDLKKPKRTPSFTTRRRTQSFRKLQKIEQKDLPPVEIHGILDRKQELQSGGKKAPVRSWKTFYTVLCGQLLCFFKDQEDFVNSKAASSPVSILKAKCEKAQDYTKRKHVFRLCCTDGSEYLFLADTEEEMLDWVNKLTFHAELPPSMQLLSYDESQKNAEDKTGDVSSGSSRASSPDRTSPARPVQTQTQFLTQHRPAVPPRTAPPPVPPPVSMRTKINDGVDVRDGPARQNGTSLEATFRRSIDTSPSPGYGNVPPTKYNQRPVSMPPAQPENSPRRASESSSESEQPTPIRTKDKDKRSSVLTNLFRKKKATHL